MNILIISALPYDASSSTRAFKTYFKSLNKNNISQIYTNKVNPDFTYCNNFYQITDKRMLKCRFHKKMDPGIIFSSGLSENCSESTNSVNNRRSQFLKKDIGFIHLFRNFLWKKKKWFTEKLKTWITDFNPDIVFYHNSNSLFISKIAKTIASYFKLPLLVEISDDYFFTKRKFGLLFSSIYNKKYKTFFKTLVTEADGCFFISEKMKNKYESFSIQNSGVIHIASEAKIEQNECANVPYTFCYFGNTGFNRHKTLIKLGKRLNELNNDFRIDVYSPLQGNTGFDENSINSGINQCGFLEYEELIKKVKKYDFLILAEPLDFKTANYIGLSLSTKVGDMLALRKKIICAGNISSGTIEYMANHNSGIVLKSEEDIQNLSLDKLANYNWNEAILNCEKAFLDDFSMESNSEKARAIIENAINLHGINNGKC